MRVAFWFSIALLVSTGSFAPALPRHHVLRQQLRRGYGCGHKRHGTLGHGRPGETAPRSNQGDTVLFACGGTWRESLQFGVSGTAAAPITYAASGVCAQGAKPTFSGADLLSGWIPDAQPAVFSVALAAAPVRVFVGDLHLLPAPAKAGTGRRLLFLRRRGAAPAGASSR